VTEQVLDVRGALRVIRTFWRTVLVVLLVGAAAAAADAFYSLPKYQATTLVLLPAPASTSGTTPAARQVTTDARIATSAAVLLPAGRSADPSLSLETLQRRVTALNAATSVLKIVATGSTRRGAEDLANAVANQLVAFFNTSGATATSNVQAGLRAEEKQLNTQISDVQSQLSIADNQVTSTPPTSRTAPGKAKVVSSLQAQEQSLILQLNGVKSELSQAQLQQIAANEGTEVIQHATTATPPAVSAFILPVLLGALGGLVVGSVLVLVRHRRDPKLRTLNAISEAVGAPVLASLEVGKHHSTADWQALLEQYEPSSLERWTVRRALRELGVGGDGTDAVQVLAFSGDAPGVALAVHVALAMAASGVQTALSVVATGNDEASLRAVCSRYEHEEPVPRRGLEVSEGATSRRAGSPSLAVTALIIETVRNASPLGLSSAPTVVSVSSGFASAEQLAAMAIGAVDVGSPLKGVLVANPISSDPTVGRPVDARVRSGRHARRADAFDADSALGQVR